MAARSPKTTEMEVRALITGAGRGIGAAIARALAEAGHPVIVNYRSDRAAAEGVCAQIAEAGGSAELAGFDVTDKSAVDASLKALLEDERPIGILVNNAGVIHDGPFPRLSERAWTDVTRTTLDGFYNVTRPLVMPMVRRRWGRIINIASLSGVSGNRGQVNYSAAKAGLIGATRALARELAKRAITVNAIAPGLIDTDMTAGLPDQALEAIPMRRMGRPEEVAALARFLAGDGAGYITGEVIGVTGGLG